MKVIDRLPWAARDPANPKRVLSYARRDGDMAGLIVVVNERSKTFAVQRDLYSPAVDTATGFRMKVGTRRVRLGEVREFATIDEARARARQVIALMRRGIDPNVELRRPPPDERAPWQRVTLREAWETYARSLVTRGRSPVTQRVYKAEFASYYQGWLGRTLVEIATKRAEIVALHDTLTSARGPVAANKAMRLLRAVYRRARRLYPELPDHPVSAVDLNPEKRREDAAMRPDELPAWYATVCALPNPIRRDAHLFALLSGLRTGREGHLDGVGIGVVTLRWEYVDWEGKVLRLPRTKNRQPLLVPLSDRMLEILRRRKLENAQVFAHSPWVFPAGSRTGHMWSMLEKSGKTVRLDKTGHSLRHCYVTLAQAAGVPRSVVARLVGHVSANMTESYTHGEAQLEFLIETQQRITDFLWKHLRSTGEHASVGGCAAPSLQLAA